MRRALVFSLVSLALSCSLFRAKIAPYPAGVTFPLEEAGRVEFEGKVVGGLAEDEAGQLFFSTDKGYLYCLDKATQEISWDFANPFPFGCAPAFGPERLFVWDEENSVFCLDKKGKLLWNSKIAEMISSSISLDHERVYLGTETGCLFALSQATGEILWRFETKGIIAAAPVFFDNQLYLGSGDGKVYMLSPKGGLRGTIDIGSPILVTPLVDGHRLYVGTEDRVFHCYDLGHRKRKWMITAGGCLLATPRTDQKRVYFPASNGVLYALNKKNGHILWWWISPSKSRYGLEFDGQNILTTSASPYLHSLDMKSGKELGKYDAKEEIRSNPVWAEPYLFFALFDPAVNKGRIVFLRKEVNVKLSPSLASPQLVGTEVSFTASATGFYRPQFEFSLVRGEERTVVQAASERTTWVWFADKEGSYTISVNAKDEKQSQEVEISYEITKNDKTTVR
ncbi:MAG: PQQ-binding-like beta-propeller repeat protein [Candidatus Aminicenantales bacterium]